MRTAKKTSPLSLNTMLETIRINHIDIIPIIQAEINTILPEYIESIIQNVYVSLTENADE